MKHQTLSSAEAFTPDAISNRRFSLYSSFVKPLSDAALSLLLLPVLMVCTVLLMMLNPFFNKGPLFFVQTRMGRDCKAFKAIKFRTMRPTGRVVRGADDPLERDRITPLGHVLRRSRIDELPQILNVLRGEMSLIGPRPDFFHHARRYVRTVPGYRRRHAVRPGISGLAQTDLGYTATTDATRLKVRLDLHYVQNQSLALDAYIFWRTLVTVFRRKGC